ncbi:unnamed protein product, partial [Scytosiphon promiscuus]
PPPGLAFADADGSALSRGGVFASPAVVSTPGSESGGRRKRRLTSFPTMMGTPKSEGGRRRRLTSFPSIMGSNSGGNISGSGSGSGSGSSGGGAWTGSVLRHLKRGGRTGSGGGGSGGGVDGAPADGSDLVVVDSSSSTSRGSTSVDPTGASRDLATAARPDGDDSPRPPPCANMEETTAAVAADSEGSAEEDEDAAIEDSSDDLDGGGDEDDHMTAAAAAAFTVPTGLMKVPPPLSLEKAKEMHQRRSWSSSSNAGRSASGVLPAFHSFAGGSVSAAAAFAAESSTAAAAAAARAATSVASASGWRCSSRFGGVFSVAIAPGEEDSGGGGGGTDDQQRRRQRQQQCSLRFGREGYATGISRATVVPTTALPDVDVTPLCTPLNAVVRRVDETLDREVGSKKGTEGCQP